MNPIPQPVYPMHILLIEDDPMIGCSLTRALEDAGLSVVWIRDGINGELAAVQGEYSLILLDLGLPEQSGLSILTNLRNQGNRTPLLIITASDEIDNRVAGLEAGADDYLIKPFGFKELMARIHAVLRRTSEQTAAILGNGEISLVISTHEASYRGKTLLLPAREFALLYTLVDKPGSIFSREQIEARLYQWRREIGSSAVDVLIHYLRKKFDTQIIRNVRGVGWMVVKHP